MLLRKPLLPHPSLDFLGLAHLGYRQRRIFRDLLVLSALCGLHASEVSFTSVAASGVVGPGRSAV